MPMRVDLVSYQDLKMFGSILIMVICSIQLIKVDHHDHILRVECFTSG